MTLALGIAGYSGAGKTTLIEALLPRLAERGLRVGVVKHDAHKLTLDREGKDTARFYAAGAQVVCAHDPGQHFVRTRSEGSVLPSEILVGLPADLDFVLVEGHKDAPLSKLVLAHHAARPAIEGPEVLATLGWGDLEGRLATAERLVTDWLAEAWQRRPVGVVVLVGGRSSRMGASKALLEYDGRPLLSTLVERLRDVSDCLLLAGDGPIPEGLHRAVPEIPDVPCAEGPMAGLLAVMRHDPRRAWLVVGCDQPEFGAEHARWLIEARRPGMWAIVPRLADRSTSEPLGAIYEPPVRALLERACARGHHALYRISNEAPSASPTPPADLARGWLNANTPADWQSLTGSLPKELHG